MPLDKFETIKVKIGAGSSTSSIIAVVPAVCYRPLSAAALSPVSVLANQNSVSCQKQTEQSIKSTWHQSASELLHPTSAQCRAVCDKRLSLNNFGWRLKISFRTAMNTTRCWQGYVKLLSKKVRFSYLLQQHVQKWTCCCSK